MNNIAHDRLREEGPGYDPLTGAYHCQHDWDGPGRLSQTVSEVILTLAGLGPAAGQPLSDAVDPDALDQLFGTTRETDSDRDHLTFTHQDCRVTVYRDGHVVAYPPDETGRPLYGSGTP